MGLKRSIKRLIQKTLHSRGYEVARTNRGVEVNCYWLTHFVYLKEVYDLAANVEGDVVECGVGSGKSFFKLCFLAARENKGRRVYGFDSFEGFPEPSKEDESPRNPRRGEWKVATVAGIEAMLVRRGQIDPSFAANNVRLIKGFFEDTVRLYDGGPIAVLHLDVDLYESYKVTLDHFWPLVAKGGVVLFDEYKQPNALKNFPGASKAIDEHLGELTKEIQFNAEANRYYIIKP